MVERDPSLGESIPEISPGYLFSLVRRAKDKSSLAVPLRGDSVNRQVVIDGDKEAGWWVSRLYAFEGGLAVVTSNDDKPRYDFVDVSRLWDFEAAVTIMVEQVRIEGDRAIDEFEETIEEYGHPN